MKTIYLDNAASMPMPPKVLEAVANANKQFYANPFSLHFEGRQAYKVLNEARKDLAEELGVKTEEIIFTSGGTESNALALLGAARARKKENKNKIIISSIEHSSIYENAKELKSEGFIVIEIPITESKGLDFNLLEKELDSTVAIVSMMSINSDTGIVNDITRVARLCKKKNVIFHVDHLQGFGKMDLQPKSLGIDLLSADAHKIGGPKGIGMLYLRNGVSIDPLFVGAKKEYILRPGTENVSGAIGFAAALKECKKTDWRSLEENRDFLEEELGKLGARITAADIRRSSTHLHVCFKEVKGEDLVNYLSTKGICCSTGSACDSNNKEKRVLRGLEIPEEYHQGAVRFSLGPENTRKEMSTVVKEVKSFLNRFKNAH